MNIATNATNYPLLRDDEIETLKQFIELRRTNCENSHELGETQEEVRKKICECLCRAHPMTISCVHAEENILWEKWARDILNQTITIFWESDQKMENLLMFYRDTLRMSDFIRQAIEGYYWNMYENIVVFKWWLNIFPDDIFFKKLIELSNDILHYRINGLTNKAKEYWLIRFRSLKNHFSSEWEPEILDKCRKYAQDLLNHQSD